MMKKQTLRQDMFLLTFPGPLARYTALSFAAATNHEVEYVALSSDVSESDLKLRREYRGGYVST